MKPGDRVRFTDMLDIWVVADTKVNEELTKNLEDTNAVALIVPGRKDTVIIVDNSMLQTVEDIDSDSQLSFNLGGESGAV